MVLIYTNIITHSYYYCYFDSSPNQQEKHVKICQDMSSDMTWPSHERFATRCPWAASPLAWREMSDWRWDVSWPWDVHWPLITWLKRREKYHQPGGPNQQSWCSHVYMAMDQYLLMPFLVGWTSIYQPFWCSPGVQGFDTLPYGDITGKIVDSPTQWTIPLNPQTPHIDHCWYLFRMKSHETPNIWKHVDMNVDHKNKNNQTYPYYLNNIISIYHQMWNKQE